MTDSTGQAESISVNAPELIAPLPVRVPEAPPAAAAPSFRALFEAESSYVWNTLQRLGVQTRDVEDVAHEVFITVHRRLAEYDPTRPLRPWLFGIALRTAMRYRDLARHHREALGMEVDPADPAPRADDQMVAAEARALVLEALDALDLDRRAVFVMHDIDETPIPEVAEALAIPLNTAYSRLRRAREQWKAAVTRIRLRRGVP